MKTIRRRNIIALLICLGCLGTTQQQAHAQWVPDGQYDYYKTQEERLRALDQSLTLLEKADPMVDLRAAISKRDTRLIIYTGYAPGVPRNELISAFKRRNGFKVLKGSTDMLTGDLGERLDKVIQNYMKPYNQALLRYLASKNRGSKK